MTKLLLIAGGGALGAVFRFLCDSFLLKPINYKGFPLSIMMVNLIGCLLIGFYLGKSQGKFNELNAFFVTGFLGAFTTFSTFGLQMFNLLKNQEISLLVSYVLISVFGGLLFVYIGFLLSNTFNAS